MLTVILMDDSRSVVSRSPDHWYLQEASFAHPWAVSDAPLEFTEKLLNGVVGIEIAIAKLVGQWKVSQNRPESDRVGVVRGLRDVGETAMAKLVEHGKD